MWALFIHLPTCLISFIHYNSNQNYSATVRCAQFCFHFSPPTSAPPQPLTYGGTDVRCKQIDENCTNEINKNPAVLAPLLLYPLKRTLCSLPDDATINEIPVIDCFKLLWRLETGQCGQDRRRKRKNILCSASEMGTVCETNVCRMPGDRRCSQPIRFYLAFSYSPHKYALLCSSCHWPPPSGYPSRKMTVHLRYARGENVPSSQTLLCLHWGNSLSFFKTIWLFLAVVS